MRQVVQNYHTGELSIADIPSPLLRPNGVLVAVAASLVSAGTERGMVSLAQASLIDKARQRPDLVRQVLHKAQQEGVVSTYQKVMTRLDSLTPLGYSCAGTVIEVGKNVTDVQIGDRVACAGAGYANHAEIVFVPRNLVAVIPGRQQAAADEAGTAEISFEAAAFATLGAIALQGIRQIQPTLGETVLVIGLGLVGLLTVQLLKANGCRVIGMDLDPARCALAEQLGCDVTATSRAATTTLAASLTNGFGVDAALIAASTRSNEPVELSAELCRERGRVVVVGMVGLQAPRQPFYDKELDLRLSRSYGPGRYDPAYEEQGHDYPIGYVRWTENRNMQAFLDLVAQRKIQVEPLITHRFSIEAALDAYALITGEQARSALGVILTYPHDRSDHPATVSSIVRMQPPSKPARAQEATARASIVQIGLIGAGAFAQGTLLPALKSLANVQLRAVGSASGLSARHVAAKYAAAYCTSDAGQIMRDPQLDAVLIATRHSTHAPLAVEALGSGKPVFVEKPLAIDEEQLRTVVDAYNAQGAGLLLVGFNRRFAPLAVMMNEFLHGRGPLVLQYRVNAGFVPHDSWLHDPREGGGRIVGEVCHFVDFMQFLTGANPRQVHAMALGSMPNRDSVPEDNVTIQIRFDDGSVGNILYVANGDRSLPKERVEGFGGGRVAVLNDFRTLELYGDGKKRVERSWFTQDKGHAAELAAFVQAVRSNDVSPIPFADLAQTTLATFRIRESLRSGLPQQVAWSPETHEHDGDHPAALEAATVE